MVPPLFQGGAYSEFKEEFDNTNNNREEEGFKLPDLVDAIRIINEQSEIIVENLNEMKNTARDRRQSIAYLLEQCILIASALPTADQKDRVLFRRIRRRIEQARRLTRGDRL